MSASTACCAFWVWGWHRAGENLTAGDNARICRVIRGTIRAGERAGITRAEVGAIKDEIRKHGSSEVAGGGHRPE